MQDDSKGYFDREAYNLAINKYYNARDKYAESQVYDARWDGAYRKLRDERVKAAEETFIAANPEPPYGTPEYDNWVSALENAKATADPIQILSRIYYNEYNTNL